MPLEFQDAHACSKLFVDRCQAGRGKVEATLLFFIKHQKEKDTPTSWHTQELNWHIFSKNNLKVLARPHPRGYRVLEVTKMTEGDLFKK